MKIQELHIALQKLGISEDKYYIQGLYGSMNDEDKLSMVVKKGSYFLEYEIYFKERGEKSFLKVFTNEDEACQYFYKQLKEDREIENRWIFK